MTVLQPFDRHPADPASLTGHGSSLATQASHARTALDPDTQRAYAPVPAGWRGMGEPEARQSGVRVSTDAGQVSERVAGAAVALAYWARCVGDFNDEVARILDTVTTAGTGPAAAGHSPDEIAAIRSAARRDGEIRWQTAFESHIAGGRTQVGQILREGPGAGLILDLFQAGMLPMAVVNLYPRVDYGRINWRTLFANLRGQGIDPLTWAASGTHDPELLKVRLDLLRALGVPPRQYRELLQTYWVSVAAEKAGIDLSQWDPSRGAEGLRGIIEAVYTYYGNLFQDNPYMQWAGMANMIGPSFAAGFFDLHMLRDLASRIGDRLDDLPYGVGNHLPGILGDLGSLGADLTAEDIRFFETTFLQMQKDIFFDQAMMHEAYLGGGMDAIEELRAAGLLDNGDPDQTVLAWQQIDDGRRTGNPDLITAGNEYLLFREQHDIIDDSYQTMKDHPVTGEAVTYLMGAVGQPSIPGANTLAEVDPYEVEIKATDAIPVPGGGIFGDLIDEVAPVPRVEIGTPLPDGNIADFETRWNLIEADTLPAYQELLREDPDQAREIIGSDVHDRIEDERLSQRWDDIVRELVTNWEVRVDVE